MIARHGEQNGCRPEVSKYLPQITKGLGERGEFLDASSLGKIASEEHNIPRPAIPVQFGKIVVKLLPDVGPEPTLTTHALVQIA